jgi:hypothetical protein
VLVTVMMMVVMAMMMTVIVGMSAQRTDSLLNGFTRQRRIGRQGKRTQIDRRRAIGAQAVIQDKQLGVGQALAE